MQLSNIQNLFKDQMLRHEENVSSDFSALFNSGDIPLKARLRIYQENIRGRLCSVIMENYPAVSALVGHDFMRTMVRCYVAEHPPVSGCLDDYGVNFPDFINAYKPASSLPYLFDISCLERAILYAEKAHDDKILEPEMLSNFSDLAEVRLYINQCVSFIGSSYPVKQIYDYVGVAGSQTHSVPDLNTGPEYVLIKRNFLKAELIEITAQEYYMLNNLAANPLLEAALEVTLISDPYFNFSEFLQKFIGLEVFATR